MSSFLKRAFLGLVACLVAIVSTAPARDAIPTVTYFPVINLVAGDQPLHDSYPLQITSPNILLLTQTVSITPVITVLSKPAGVTDAQALSYVTLSPSTLVFTAPGQTQTTTVTCDVPAGNAAGDFQYTISTPGWPIGTYDGLATINMRVTVPIDQETPSIVINSPADGATVDLPVPGPAITVPFSFQASSDVTAPITDIGAMIGGQSLTITGTGLGTEAASGAGTLTFAAPGIYTVRAFATNINGTSATSVDVTVRAVAPPPTVAILQPIVTNYVLPVGGSLNIPFSISAISAFGGVTNVSATLNGSPVSVSTNALPALIATGSGTLHISGGGNYTLGVTATDQNGTSSATLVLHVTAATPIPNVSISQPVNGLVVTRIAGSPATSIPFVFTATTTTGFKIDSLNASLGAASVTVTPAGLGTTSATGVGVLLVNAPGTYTFTAGALSGTTAGSSTATFTVKEEQPPPPSCSLLWLPPISLGKVQQGGSTLPIKFRLFCASNLACGCNGEHDTSVKIGIYEILPGGAHSPVQIFSYGTGSPNPPDYAINGDDQYHLNFPVAKGKHVYHIDVYRFLTGSPTPQLLGTKEFTSK
jgi:hypothetical protein